MFVSIEAIGVYGVLWVLFVLFDDVGYYQMDINRTHTMVCYELTGL